MYKGHVNEWRKQERHKKCLGRSLTKKKKTFVTLRCKWDDNIKMVLREMGCDDVEREKMSLRV
jgi:hypothetical protein